MCLLLRNVLILKSSADLCLFFTNFVLVFHKMSRKRAYYKFFTLCPKKRGCFMVKDLMKAFFIFSVFLNPCHDPKVGRRRLELYKNLISTFLGTKIKKSETDSK